MTHYDTLGVSKDSTDSEIKKAYKQLAKKHHPDVGGDEATFKEIANAYDAIKTKELRDIYEAELTGRPFRHPHNFNDIFNGDMNDIFKEFFGERLDRQYFVELTLEEAYTGKQIIINHNGMDYPINIPGGIDTGMSFRVQGLGAKSQDGKRIGDLIVKAKIKPHQIFRRAGIDLQMDVDISYIDCILGMKTTINTISGATISITIPECTNHKSKLRIIGHGMKYMNGTGDLYVVINSVMPNSLTTEEKIILTQLKKD